MACSECSALRTQLAEKVRQLQAVEHQLADYTTSSQELEAELERELTAAQKEIHSLQTRLEKQSEALQAVRNELRQSGSEQGLQISSLQHQLTELRETNKKLQIGQRELEQRKDDAQRNERAQEFLVKDLQEKLDAALEANVLLQQDYETSDTRNRELIQRLEDELRDAFHDLDVLNKALDSGERLLQPEDQPNGHRSAASMSKEHRTSVHGQAIYYEPTACCSTPFWVCFWKAAKLPFQAFSRRHASQSYHPPPVVTRPPQNSFASYSSNSPLLASAPPSLPNGQGIQLQPLSLARSLSSNSNSGHHRLSLSADLSRSMPPGGMAEAHGSPRSAGAPPGLSTSPSARSGGQLSVPRSVSLISPVKSASPTNSSLLARPSSSQRKTFIITTATSLTGSNSSSSPRARTPSKDSLGGDSVRPITPTKSPVRLTFNSEKKEEKSPDGGSHSPAARSSGAAAATATNDDNEDEEQHGIDEVAEEEEEEEDSHVTEQRDRVSALKRQSSDPTNRRKTFLANSTSKKPMSHGRTESRDDSSLPMLDSEDIMFDFRDDSPE